MFQNEFKQMRTAQSIQQQNYFLNVQSCLLVFIFILCFFICPIARHAHAIAPPAPGEIRELEKKREIEKKFNRTQRIIQNLDSQPIIQNLDSQTSGEISEPPKKRNIEKKSILIQRFIHELETSGLGEISKPAKKKIELALKHSKNPDASILEDSLLTKELAKADKALPTQLSAAVNAGEITGNITGRVTAPNGTTPIEGIYVSAYVYDPSDCFWHGYNSASTDINGNYDIGGLPSGTYRVEFRDYSGAYLGEYYNNQSSLELADNIALTAPNTTSGINASLSPAGNITGKVTGPDGVTPLQNVYVFAYIFNEPDCNWDQINYGYTDADGNYDIVGLPSGTYRVEFYDYFGGHFEEWYNNKSSRELADDIPVTAPNTVSNINAALSLGGYISGKVTGPDGSTPLQNIHVSAYTWNESDFYWDPINSAYTDADGNYNIPGLPSGTYRVSFRDYNSGTYLDEYYNNKPTLDSANDIPVTAPNTTPGINASLALAGHITGKVTGPDGSTPLQDIYASANFWNGSYWESVSYGWTDADGNYNIGRLPSGTYRVAFYDYSGTGTYADEYYNNQSSLDSANDIPVTAPETTSGINASLALFGTVITDGGHITGTVTGPDGFPVNEIIVEAYVWNAEGSYWNSVSYDYTNACGDYDIDGLPSGTYRVAFHDYDGTYITEYYNNQPDMDSAVDIPVTAPGTVEGINASLALAGHITGKVAGPDGSTPLNDIAVEAYAWNTEGSYWDSVSYDYTNACGNYKIGGLPSGTYRIVFYDWSGTHVTEYYNNQSDLGLATDIPVTAPNTESNINASLSLGGHISGKVTGPDGTTPLQNIIVWVWFGSSSFSNAWGQWINPDGTYNIGGLPSGTYRIEFHDTSDTYRNEYYNNKSSLDTANNIVVTAPTTISGINASLNKNAMAITPLLQLLLLD